MRYIIRGLVATLIGIGGVVICFLPIIITLMLNVNIIVGILSFILGIVLMFIFIFWVAENVDM